jgi:hypothetical protein
MAASSIFVFSQTKSKKSSRNDKIVQELINYPAASCRGIKPNVNKNSAKRANRKKTDRAYNNFTLLPVVVNYKNEEIELNFPLFCV